MIKIQQRELHVDGRARVLMAGEIHYFRVARAEWADRVDSLVAAGCDTVASYIPWLFHELPDGTIDVTGATRPERDLAAFVDLCADRGLRFLARPGPYVMAELKNEGLPYRVLREHPEILPSGWDGVRPHTATVDYLAPAFLEEAQRWLHTALAPLASRLEPDGGNVVAVQLDNEIGMLQWVTNSPDLTDQLVHDLHAWAAERHGDALASRYPVPAGLPWADAVRSPHEEWAAALRVDLGLFMRDRFARYARALQRFAEEAGIHDVPFLINIHGTSDGDGGPFPIGVSQLVDTYAGVPGVLAGSDHYLGEVTLGVATDLHVINALMAAVNDADQPTTSLEFEAGSGDYGGGDDMQYDPSSVALKTRWSVAQGNRLINYYLFAGGINPMLDEPVGDGNDRLSFTGERHGTAAPVGPEGQRSVTFPATRDVVHAVKANEPWLARMHEEHDGVALGVVLDAYMTEYHHPGSAVMTELVEDLERHRGAGPRKALGRSLLLGGFRFGGVDLQAGPPPRDQVVVLAAGRVLDLPVQEHLVTHLRDGGRLLLLGRVPEIDLEGRPCTVLADALGVRGGEVRWGGPSYFPSVVSTDGAAALGSETRVGWLQPLEAAAGTPLLLDVSDRSPCAVEVQVGPGRAAVVAAELPSHRAFFTDVLDRLGVRPGLEFEPSVPGLLATTTATAEGERLLHLINISGHPNTAAFALDGTKVFGGRPVDVPARSGWMLPLGLEVPLGRIVEATAEVTHADGTSLSLLPIGPGGFAVVETDRELSTDDGTDLRRDGRRWTVTSVDGSPIHLSSTPNPTEGTR
jgi:beta-galactosidase